MTPEQFQSLLQALIKLSEKQYTLTGAADWPILAAFSALLVAIIGWMWIDLKSTIRAGREEWRAEMNRETDKIWNALRDCKDDCCITNKSRKS